MGNRYVVKNEHTLGYIHPDYPQFMQVLHGSVLKGGHDWRNGAVCYSEADLREATQADFDEYRVCSKGHLS